MSAAAGQAPAGRAAAGSNALGVPVARLGGGALALVMGMGALIASVAVLTIVGIEGVAGVGAGSAGAGALEGALGGAPQAGVSALALREIPPEYLRLYEAAGVRYGLEWAVLAGIGKVECDHGRDPDPSCTREGAVNAAGAGGPMQFLASTWAEYGVSAEGSSGPPDRWSPADAIYGAANYLRASGAPGDYRKAIYAYNHAWWYVEEVEDWARKYSSPPVASAGAGVDGVGVDGADVDGVGADGADMRLAAETSTPVRFVAGEQARLEPGEGHVALIPEGVPAKVQAMLVAGNELQDLPYGPGGHPDPLGASEEDCSSTVNYVLYRAGVRPLREILTEDPVAQDYVHWGEPGQGRWVTIYATDAPVPHVFMVIAGLRLDTSHDGTDEGPNREEDGPRWRILPYIPTWAHWSVRHPPGL